MDKLQIEYLPLFELKPYENNPRINEQAVDPVAKSIKLFGFKIPILIDSNGVIVCGHTRLLSAQKLGLEQVPVIRVDDLTDEQIKAFRLIDNKVSEVASWDFDLLSTELDGILDIDMSDFGFDLSDNDKDDEKYDYQNGSLADKFIAPPFSVLDTRQGYWQDRTKMWENQIGINGKEGRKQNLQNTIDVDKSHYTVGNDKFVAATSEFDPTIAEVMYKWFCIDKGIVLDPFAGGVTRGAVAQISGYDYIGFDIRKEQIDENNEQSKTLQISPKYYCEDSQKITEIIDDESIDFVFSCPPYFDLEKYSDNPLDISNMSDEQFADKYKKIIFACCKKLKQDRFAAFVVGDVRNKKGEYKGLIELTKQCFLSAGLCLYNDMILLQQAGTAALRANRQFQSMRKVVKIHENILVFYKGEIKHISNNYNPIEVDETGEKTVKIS